MEQPLSAQEIPVEDIATRDFVLAEDVVSAKKVLLLPKGVDLSWFGSAKRGSSRGLNLKGLRT